MPQTRRTKSPINDLLMNGSQYSFFEAVRTLHALHKDSPRLGREGPPQRERIRLRPALSMVFPRSDIQSLDRVEQPDGAHRYIMEVAFMGLYGTSSPLPSHYTEDFLRREETESLLRGFLDLFHHRLLSLFYRVWEKYRHSVQYDGDGRDYYSSRLLSLLGADLAHQPSGRALPPVRLLAYAGLLTQQPRSAESLRALLQEHFPEGRVEIEQCLAGFADIPADQQTRLAARNTTLAQDAVLGARAPDRGGIFGIRLGPLSLENYLDMMPDRDDMNQLRELVDLFNQDGLDYDVMLILRGQEVPRAQLNSPHTRLGWSSWLGESRTADRGVSFRFKGWRHGRG